MRELREDTFFGNKNDDAHDHVERVLDIVSLFNIPGVTHDAVMLRVFPITLTGAAKRWVDRLSPGTIDSWDLLMKAFIQIHQKVNIFYNGLGTMNRQFLDSHGSIPGMTPAQALIAIQIMTDHSQKWHDGSSSRNIDSSSNSKGIAAIVSKLDSLGRDMKKLNESVHAIPVGCQLCRGPYLDMERPLNKEANEKLRETHEGLGGKKPRTEEDEEIRMNRRCSDLLQNQLPPKEQDPGSFILLCSIGRLDFSNALADSEASISIMPLSMYKRLGMGNSKQLTCKDEENLEGILDYLEPKSCDRFIDFDDEAYNERKCRLLGFVYKEPSPILIEKVEVIRYTIGPGETYTKVKVMGIDEMPRTNSYVATIRAGLIEETSTNRNTKGET
nr:hypothetical protein [Tanacetum cinerariifolium]